MKNPTVAVFFTLLPAAHSDEEKTTLLNSKIIGGNPSSATYVVSLHSQGLFYGAASLISNKHAITCASLALCFPSPDFKSAYVNVGSTYILRGVKHYFEDIIYHNSSHPLPNFAILCLNETVKFSDYVTPIPILQRIVRDGTEGYVSGWGGTDPNGPRPHFFMSYNLKELRVRILSHDVCLQHFPQMSNLQMCANSTAGDAARPYLGDLGDPLVVEINGQRMLIGILISVKSQRGAPLAYTKLFSYYNYIMEKADWPIIPSVIDLPSHYELWESTEEE